MGIPLGTMVGFAAGGAIADTLGWRTAMFGAGAVGALIAALAFIVVGPTPPLKRTAANSEPFVDASRRLLSSPAFRWLFVGAIAVGFAATPFYAFSVPFLIRTYGYSASEVGLAFGPLQGLMGILGALGGGRWFDRAVRSGTGRVLGPPAVLFVIASATTAAALFAPVGWMSILLMVPGMLSFSFMMPWVFGAAHLVAGKGKEAMATSLLMIGSGLLGPALGPLIVGMVSDAATAAQIPNGLGLGLLIVPVASVLTGVALLIANRRIAASLRRLNAASVVSTEPSQFSERRKPAQCPIPITPAARPWPSPPPSRQFSPSGVRLRPRRPMPALALCVVPAKPPLSLAPRAGSGAATARRLVRDGYAVTVNYLTNREPAAQVVADVEAADGRAIFRQADVADPGAVRSCSTQTTRCSAARMWWSTTPGS